MNKFTDLKIYQKAYDLTINIYKITKKFPSDEKFGLVSQMRRASTSIISNIAEGNAKKSDKDFLRYLYISLGSLEELKALLHISKGLGYIDNESYNNIQNQCSEATRLLLGFMKVLKASS